MVANNMTGYIGITDPGWYKFQKEHKRKAVFFWRKAEKPINLSEGTYFFFLIKGPSPRYIKGYGTVKEIGSDYIKSMWDKHRDKMGSDSFEVMKSRMEKEENEKVGYYILEDVHYTDHGIKLEDSGVPFALGIVSGKKIGQKDTEKLLASFRGAAGVSQQKEKKQEPESKALSKNLIMYGPPGTGKTFKTREASVNRIETQK